MPRLLGKLPPSHDPRALKLAHYLRADLLPAPPDAVDWTGGVDDWGMMKNDEIGDCAIADPAHGIQAWTQAAKGRMTTISDADVVTAYSAVSGYRPGRKETDVGCVMTDVLRYWRRTGIGGHKIDAYADVDPKEHTGVKQALDLFGGFSIGLSLPKTASDQLDAGKPWTVTSLSGDGARGSWGGHAVRILKYDATWLYCVTWSKIQKLSWKFLDVYCDEVHAPISVDWFNERGYNPRGLDWTALARDLAEVADAPLVFPVGPNPFPGVTTPAPVVTTPAPVVTTPDPNALFATTVFVNPLTSTINFPGLIITKK